MRIGIISNTDSFVPFVYTLAAQQLQVYIFFSPARDSFVQQKVEAFVTQFKLPFTEERNPDKDLYQWLHNGNYDVCFILGYAHLIKLDRLKGCTTPLFNIHFGPLPGFRGPVPVFWQLKNGMENVGLAIHKLSSKFDDGSLVWTKDIPNQSHYNYQTVNQVLSQACIEGVFFIVRLLLNRMPIPEAKPAIANASYQKRPTLADVSIHWEQQSAIEICNLVRACNPWNKGAITMFKGNEVKLIDAQWIDSPNPQATPGTIIANGQCLTIATTQGKAIAVNMLFLNDCYVPAYDAPQWGLTVGEKLC